METATVVLADLFVMFLAAKVAGELFERCKQPAVIGELLVGVALGPFALGWVGVPTSTMIADFQGEAAAWEAMHALLEMLATLGAIILLFVVGLETRLSEVMRVGVRATVVAVAGVIVPFVLGYMFVASLGRASLEAVFVATAMVATSVGITARVLADLGQIDSDEARIILAAAVIDDVIGLIALAIVSALGGGDRLSPAEIALITGQAIAFTVLITLAGAHLVRQWSIHLEKLRIRNAPFVVAVLVMLGLATLSTQMGLAAIVGAFLAGMVFAELREQYELERQALPIYEFLVPLFFVITGTRVDWRLFLDGSLIGIALTVTALAIIGKLIGCGAAALGRGWWSVAVIGVGMAPRGEVGLIVANVGKSAGAIPDAVFSTVVIMSVLTTFFAPPVLALLYRGRAVPAAVSTRPETLDEFAVADQRLPDF